MRRQQFRRGRNVLVNCRCCGKKTHSNLDGVGVEMCRVCLESSGQLNAHSDGAHRTDEDCRNNNCPVIQGVDCLHELNA